MGCAILRISLTPSPSPQEEGEGSQSNILLRLVLDENYFILNFASSG